MQESDSMEDDPAPDGTARGEMDALLDQCLGFAIQMLEKRGGFIPFGASIDSSGQPRFNATYDGNEHPAPTDEIELLYDGFAKNAPELRATAVCSDVSMSDGHDGGVRVEIEHRDINPITCFLPYWRKRKKFTFDEVFAVRGEPRVFPK